MLPENPKILLMHADGILHDEGLAEIIGRRHVEIVNMAEAVAAEFEAIGQASETIFASIEGALPIVVRRRIGIGYDHFGDTGAKDDGP